MDFAELQERINKHVKLDLAPLYEDYKATSKTDGIDGFISFLASARVIDNELLTELHTEGAVEIPRADDPALAGTHLADLMQGGAAQEAAAEASQDVRFQPLTRLGQGAMGAIDIARDLYLRRKVALKTVLPEMSAHPQLLSRFLTEMQITAQLEHPNVVPVYALEVGQDGSLGYAMKLVHGRDLGQIIELARAAEESGKPVDPELGLDARLEIFLKVCDALDFAHSKGIVHRDLKPSNIMVGRHHEVYLMDWGIARPMGAGGKAVDSGIELHVPEAEQGGARTRVGSTIGTPSYMSPEQAAGRNHELDGRSDVYAMGLILQECWTLHQAVQGTTLQELLTKAREGQRDRVAPGRRGGSLPKEVDAIIAKATALRPEERYPSAKAFADDLRRYLRNEPIQAMPDSALRKMGRWISKNRSKALTLMLAIGLVGAGGTIASLVVGQRRVAAMHARELRVSELQTESAIQAQLIDRELTRYESALTQFVGAAQLALERGAAADARAFFDEDFAKKAGPADLGPSKRYKKDISVLSPVATAPGDRAAHDALAKNLSALAPAFRELLLDTSGSNSHRLSPEQQRELIAETGVPALRASLVLTEGLAMTFPGVAAPHQADPRSELSYKAAEGKTGVHWSAPLGRGAEIVLPVSAAVYLGGQLRGVATLEVSMDRILSRPGATQLDYVQTKLLVARDGKIMAEENTPAGRAPLNAAVLEAISKGKSGSLEYEESGRKWIATYYPLATLDWYYVAIADMGGMLQSVQPVQVSDPRKVITGGAAKANGSAEAPLPPPPPPEPPPSLSASASASAEEPPDAGPPDAGAPPVIKLTGTLPKATVAPTAAPSAAPVVVPTASAIPKNPFEKWDVYKKDKPK